MSQKLLINKQVIIQDNDKWRKELDALFRYEALNKNGKEEKTERDKRRNLQKSTRSKNSKATKEGDE